MKKIIEKAFKNIGFDIIHFNEKPNANGVDCWVKKTTDRPLSVEIKKIKFNSKTKDLSIDPVSNPRRTDDLIAIIVNPNYVLI